MKNKQIKLIFIVTIIMCILSCGTMVSAYEPKGITADREKDQHQQEEAAKKGITVETSKKLTDAGMIDDFDKYDPANKIEGATTFITKAKVVTTIIRVVGTIVSVISLMIIGIKYMCGSVEEKATYKETMVPYLIGAVMLFAIPNLLGILLTVVESMSK